MDDSEFDRLIAQAGDPHLIPAIYNYCDHRCARCPFTDRCLHFRSSLEDRRRQDGSPEAALDVVTDSLGRAFEMMQIIAEREGIDLSKVDLDEAAIEDAHRRTEEDPLVELARHYATTSWPIVRALGPMLRARGDTAASDAVDTIDWFTGMIPAKVFRAVSGVNDPYGDADDLQGDWNGSAKTARLFIEESRRAWRVLMEVGRASANGVPAKLVRMLDQLDSGLQARFPRTAGFLRPGFDTEKQLIGS